MTMPAFDFTQPAFLLLLPLALLPLLRRRADTLTFAHVAWLPRDRVGRAIGMLWRAFAVGAMACAIVALAGPGQSGAQIPRTGKGAELLILLDRSSSMDAVVHLNGVQTPEGFSVREAKGEIVRRLLKDFVAKRPDDRFAFMAFSTSAFPIVPFTEDETLIQAALDAAGIGRGLPETRMGTALVAAIGEFEGRPYTGSRVILVVSDGGAQLDEPTRERIRAGLAHQKVALYWVYIRSSPNAPNLVAATTTAYGSTDELALHDFFRTLVTPYRLYQTDHSKAMEAAMAEIDRQQNFPLTVMERVPRRDFAAAFSLVALLCCAALLACRALQLKAWS
jgi:mxaC protein